MQSWLLLLPSAFFPREREREKKVKKFVEFFSFCFIYFVGELCPALKIMSARVEKLREWRFSFVLSESVSNKSLKPEGVVSGSRLPLKKTRQCLASKILSLLPHDGTSSTSLYIYSLLILQQKVIIQLYFFIPIVFFFPHTNLFGLSLCLHSWSESSIFSPELKFYLTSVFIGEKNCSKLISDCE